MTDLQARALALHRAGRIALGECTVCVGGMVSVPHRIEHLVPGRPPFYETSYLCQRCDGAALDLSPGAILLACALTHRADPVEAAVADMERLARVLPDDRFSLLELE